MRRSLGDLCRIKWTDLRGETLIVTQHKTGEPIVCRLPDECIAAMRRIESPERPRIFGSCLCRKRCMTQFVRLVQAAGLSGGSKMLRRTGATQVEIAHPGAAKAHLGHRSDGVATRHYLDHSQLSLHKPIPAAVAMPETPSRPDVLELLGKSRLEFADLREIVEQIGMTQAVLARKLGVSAALLSSVLAGHRPIEDSLQQRLRDVLGMAYAERRKGVAT